eukprot:969444-Pleurochrysis_carterae.AAC.1
MHKYPESTHYKPVCKFLLLFSPRAGSSLSTALVYKLSCRFLSYIVSTLNQDAYCLQLKRGSKSVGLVWKLALHWAPFPVAYLHRNQPRTSGHFVRERSEASALS